MYEKAITIKFSETNRAKTKNGRKEKNINIYSWCT